MFLPFLRWPRSNSVIEIQARSTSKNAGARVNFALLAFLVFGAGKKASASGFTTTGMAAQAHGIGLVL
jgi:hypothetical protein